MKSCDLCLKVGVCHFCKEVDHLVLNNRLSIYNTDPGTIIAHWRVFIAQDCKEYESSDRKTNNESDQTGS